jgi:hypothetical protein
MYRGGTYEITEARRFSPAPSSRVFAAVVAAGEPASNVDPMATLRSE